MIVPWLGYRKRVHRILLRWEKLLSSGSKFDRIALPLTEKGQNMLQRKIWNEVREVAKIIFKPTTATTTTTCWKYSVWINSGKFACHFMAQQCQTHFKEISIWTSSWWYLYLSVFALFSYPLKISKTTTAADTLKGIRNFLSKKSAKLRPNRDFLTLSNCGSPFVKALAQISITDFA